MKIINVVGARPQFIKAAMVSHELRKHPDVNEIVVHSGQHFDRNMSGDILKELDFPEIKYNLGYMYKLLSHCGLMGEFVSKGDWFTYKKMDGMVLEVTSKNKSTNQTYTMNISNIQPGIVNESFFSTKGFRISDIPEGQSCGVSVKE